MKLKRVAVRMWFYFRTGYSTYLSFPVAFVSYISVLYFLTINSISLLKQIFPVFYLFLIFTILTIPLIATMLGWFHYKRSPFYKAEQMIAIESNPYSTPIFKFYHALAIKLHLSENADELGSLLKEMRVKGFN